MDVINSSYFNHSALTQLCTSFRSDPVVPSVQLGELFTAVFYKKLQVEIKKLGFIVQRKPFQYSYASAPVPTLLDEFFSSPSFLRLMKSIVGKNVGGVTARTLRFGWKDYTLLHDQLVEKPGIDLIIDLAQEWNSAAGGCVRYVDGTGSYTTISPLRNSLTVVQRRKGVQRFVQYVNHRSGTLQRHLILGCLD